MIKKLLFVLIAVIIGLTFFIQPSRAFDKTEVRNFEPLKWVSEDNRSELILTCSLPNCLAGTFFYDGVGVKFESLVKKDQRIFNIFSLEEGDLITSFKASNKKMDFNYLNKKFCVAIDKKGLDAILESIGQEIFSENLQKKITNHITTSGDQTTVALVYELPEISIIPHLSQVLGEKLGYTGKTHPASQTLHYFALNTIKKLDTKIESETAAGDCFGMCGLGCRCWKWICGDCAYNHPGCICHDLVCRSFGIDSQLCTIMWYIPFFGCGGC